MRGRARLLQVVKQDKFLQSRVISAVMPSRTSLSTKKQGDASAFVPHKPTIQNLREAARKCKGCDLWKKATQTGFGEGEPRPSVMLIGEQPGASWTRPWTRRELSVKPYTSPTR